MGLMIHSLGELPFEVHRGYYVYLLDYGWQEENISSIHENFGRLSDLASRSDAVVIRGTVGSHFADEVLSWHHVNGQDAEDILPAILITTRHPHEFMVSEDNAGLAHSMLLISLRNYCKSPGDAVPLIEKLFHDIKDRKNLIDFTVTKELKRGKGGALVDALILQPNVGGIGVDVKSIFSFLGKSAEKWIRNRTERYT
jgi:hypothetical protein